MADDKKLINISVFFLRAKRKESQSVVASRAETHANRSSLTTSASEGMLSPHPGLPTKQRLGESLRRHASQHRAPSSQPCCGHAASEEFWDCLRLGLGQGGEELSSFGRPSAPNLCCQNHQAGSATLAGELRVGLLFRAPCCCQRHPCSSSSARSCSAISSES